MKILPRAIYRVKAIPFKTAMTFFIKIDKAILTFIWNHKRPRTAEVILSMKNKVGCVTLPGFQLYYQGIDIKTIWYGYKKDT